MTTFNNEDHPRGHPTGKSRFSDKPHSEPESALANLTAPRPVVAGWIRLEQWNDDVAVAVGATDPFNMGTVLDTYALDQVLEFRKAGPNGQDDIFERAQALGLADPHYGPFTVELDEDHLDAYIAARQAAGQDGELATQTSPATVQAQVDREIKDTYDIQHATESRLFALGAAGAQACIQQKFPDAAVLVLDNANSEGGSPSFEALRIEGTDGAVLWEYDPSDHDDALMVDDLAQYTVLLDRGTERLDVVGGGRTEELTWRLRFSE